MGAFMKIKVGTIIRVVYGLDVGSSYEVVSETFPVNIRGDLAVVCRNVRSGRKQKFFVNDLLDSIYFELV